MILAHHLIYIKVLWILILLNIFPLFCVIGKIYYIDYWISEIFPCSSTYFMPCYNMLQKVENRVRVLVDLRELASAESPDSFTLVYTNILEHQPDCPVSAIYLYCAYHTYSLVVSILTWMLSTLQPEVVDKLVSLREGIPRKDAKEVSRTELNHTNPAYMSFPWSFQDEQPDSFPY